MILSAGDDIETLLVIQLPLEGPVGTITRFTWGHGI
jgi:hypothetical protein